MSIFDKLSTKLAKPWTRPANNAKDIRWTFENSDKIEFKGFYKNSGDMKIIAIACQKGGVGKSTVAANLSVAFAQTGKNTVILDMDTQATSFFWSDMRSKAGIGYPVALSVTENRVEMALEDLQNRGCDIAIIDTRGAGDTTAAKAVDVADIVLVPVQQSVVDLQALGLTLDMVEHADTPAFIFLNRCMMNGKEAERAEAAIKKAGGIVSGIRIMNRTSYQKSMVAGLSVLEWYGHRGKKRLDIAAVTEVQKLYSFTVHQLEKLGVKK